jgi:DNA-binding transcriptional LysR family regulator
LVSTGKALISLHQLRCFLATIEFGTFTAAAAHLGYAQPSVSEQVRLLEQHLHTELFRRAGRGLVPTEAAAALRPHAAAALAAAGRGEAAVAALREMVTGTVRFGTFNTAHFYLETELIADLLKRYTGISIELVGQNSADLIGQLRRGQLEAALIALPADAAGLVITPVMTDELVYVSADPERLREPVTPAVLAAAPLVLADVSWRTRDSIRVQLATMARAAGHPLRPKVEVEYFETALELTARGLADTIGSRGALIRMRDRLPAGLGWIPLRPPVHLTFAIAHRPVADLSPATQAVVRLATDRMRAITTP